MPGFEMDQVIRASIGHVFAAWTEAALLKRWFTLLGLEVAEISIHQSSCGWHLPIGRCELGKSVHTIVAVYRSVKPSQLLAFS